MKSQQRGKSFNIWKWLFICSTLVYSTHLLYSFLGTRSSSSTAATVVNDHDSPSIRDAVLDQMETKVVRKIKSEGLTGHMNRPFSSTVNGRPYIIYNNTGHVDSMISNLHKFRQLPSSGRNELVQDFGDKKVPFLRFLHIPKAGKAFAVSMIHYCCSLLDDIRIDVNLPASHHVWKFDPSCRPCLSQPASVNGDYFAFFPFLSGIDTGRVYTFLREPISRLAFQIDHMRRLRSLMTTYGFTNQDASLLGLILSGKIIEAYKILFNVEDTRTLNYNQYRQKYSAEFLSAAESCYSVVSQRNRTSPEFNVCRFKLVAFYPGLLGCQTKLILGRNCVDQVPISTADIALAKNRIEAEFLFTGIYDRWNESVVLLHSKIGGKLWMDELRPALNLPKLEELRVLRELQTANVQDPYDSELYSFATTLFEKQWNEYSAKTVQPKTN